MEAKEFDLAGNKFTVIAMGLAAIWFLSLLMKILFIGFEGIAAYWIIAALLSFGASWLLLSKMITKRLCGLAHIFLVAIGLAILLFVNGYIFFDYLLKVLFFLIMIGLFTNIFIDLPNGLRRMMLICSAFYLFFMFLPISTFRRLPLQELFYWNFVNYSPDVIIYWIPFLIALFLVLEKVLTIINKLPEKIQPQLIHRIAFFAGLIYLAYYLIRQPTSIAAIAGFSGFMGSFFAMIFIYCLCLTLGMGVFELLEDKQKASLRFAP